MFYLIKTFYLLILFIVSFFNIIKINFLKKSVKKANYIIIEKLSNKIDRRSQFIIKNINLNECLNIIRLNQINISSIKAFIKIPNAVNFRFNIKLFKTKKFKEKIFSKIFRILQIKKILLIDDYRVLDFFSKLSKEQNIYTILYMHGKFSKKSKFLRKVFFNRYIVWSDYFKKEIENATKKKIFFSKIDVVGKYEFNKVKYFQKKINLNILFLDEDFLKPKDFIKVFSLIDNPKKYNFFFKVKITSKLPEFFKYYLKSNNIKIVDHLNFIRTIKTYNISKVVAYSSTGLLEASYFGLIPIKLNFKIKKDVSTIFKGINS